MGNRWKGEISRTILNIFRSYSGIDIMKLPLLVELYKKNFCSALCTAYFHALQLNTSSLRMKT